MHSGGRYATVLMPFIDINESLTFQALQFLISHLPTLKYIFWDHSPIYLHRSWNTNVFKWAALHGSDVKPHQLASRLASLWSASGNVSHYVLLLACFERQRIRLHIHHMSDMAEGKGLPYGLYELQEPTTGSFCKSNKCLIKKKLENNCCLDST